MSVFKKRPATPRVASVLDGVTTFVLPESLIEATLDVLVEAGEDGYEGFVVWGGHVEGDSLTYTSMIVPEQKRLRTASGLLVTVGSQALFTVNKTMYEHGETLAAQVHSHPTNAFHSDTDDCYPLITMTGALSIVVPDFAVTRQAGMSRWAWYRLTGPGEWNSLGADDKIQIDRRET